MHGPPTTIVCRPASPVPDLRRAAGAAADLVPEVAVEVDPASDAWARWTPPRLLRVDVGQSGHLPELADPRFDGLSIRAGRVRHSGPRSSCQILRDIPGELLDGADRVEDDRVTWDSSAHKAAVLPTRLEQPEQ